MGFPARADTTVELAVVDLAAGGAVSTFGPAGGSMVRGTELSPDGQQLLVTVTEPPFSVRASFGVDKASAGLVG